MRLVYLSPVPWQSFAQRPHKFVDWFHDRTGGRVLWVDPYPTRLPSLSDLRRFSAGGKAGSGSPPDWIEVLRPRALPIEPLPLSGWVNRALWQTTLKMVVDFVARDQSLLVVGKPSVFALAVLRYFRRQMTCYDAMDDFPAFYRGWSRRAMARRERQLVDRVGTVLVSSTALRERWLAVRGDVQLVHNALDPGVLPNPVARATDESRVLGYVGTVGSWFDWRWVLALADARPGDRIRITGPVFAPPPQSLPKNIEMFSPCGHAAALKQMQSFDVALIPFRRNTLTDSVDPIKYYEYRALGLPVVSTAFGEMALRGPGQGAFISRDIEDIPEVVDAALRFRPSLQEIEGFIAENSWTARFDGTGLV